MATPDDERALLWVLNLSDGRSSLLDIARRSGLGYPVVRRAAERLERAGLLTTSRPLRGGPRPRGPRDESDRRLLSPGSAEPSRPSVIG